MGMGWDREWILPAIVIAMVAALCATALHLITGYPGRPSGMTSLTAALIIVVLTAFIRFLVYIFSLWRSGDDHPITRIRADFVPALIGFAPIAIGVAIIGAFLYSITFLKSMIPAVIPFWADAPFAAMDRALFIYPQAIAIALKPTLAGLGLFYGLWHAVHLGGILWVLHWRKGNKARHIVSFMLTWSIGMALAFAFSSAGPIFTGEFDPAVAPEMTRKAADFLWANYQAKGALIGGGISAFPSMHVAIAAWFAIVLKDRGLPLIGLAYLIGVFACSVILGWHYVADSVAGIGIALVADRLSQAWLRRRQPAVALMPQPAAASN